MRALRVRPSFPVSLALAFAMLLALVPGLTAQARPAARATVSTFYTATSDAYDAWDPSATPYVAPKKSASFPAGTSTIAVYYEYDGATAGATAFSVAVKDSTGAATVAAQFSAVKYTAGMRMDEIGAPGGSFATGPYTVSLLLKGQQVAVTSFSISRTGAAHAKSTVFYTATKAAYDAWNTSTSDAAPTKTTTFPKGTSVIAFYFSYEDATPKTTQYQIVIHAPSGGVYAKRGPFTVSYDAGLVMRTVIPDQDSAYPGGTYTADLILGGRIQMHTSFSVGGSSGATIDTLYPATKAAFDAWAASATAPAPAKTSVFPAGTKIVTFYFEYKGFKAGTTSYTVVVKNQAGKTVVKHGPYVTKYVDGLQMSPVTGPSGSWPSGAYRADLLIDGHIMFSTFFSVGTKLPVTTTCTASDPLATCVEPSVLRLHADLANSMQAEGTGFVIQSDASGTYLLTNKHVVEGATPKNMFALSPDGQVTYSVLAIKQNSADAGTAGDLAVVKLRPTSLRPLTWGDSSKLRLLQKVISMGYGDAFDLPGPPTVTEGAISALNRDLGDGFGGVWIQHQSFINGGNSGGPLLDEKYNVVGVNTLSMKDTQGMFFAIPSDLARQTAAKLIASLGG